MKKIQTALISVSDKKNLKPLLNSLKKNNIKIISSGGTYKEIKKLKFKCLEVSEFTNSPEILEGRVKTLHPKIHAGILNKRKNKTHLKDLKKNNFENIDLVIVNFYPFEETLRNTKNHNKIIENIDVGGPTMVRSAAKNYKDVTVITSSNQYKELIDELKINKGFTSLKFREKLSRIAFTETAYYDSVISEYFNKKDKINFPKKMVYHANLIENPRYGENPHQESGIYSKNNSMEINQIHGKQLSYNNYNDILSALTISKSLWLIEEASLLEKLAFFPKTSRLVISISLLYVASFKPPEALIISDSFMFEVKGNSPGKWTLPKMKTVFLELLLVFC